MVTFTKPIPPARFIGNTGVVSDYNILRAAVIELRSIALQNAAEIDARVAALVAANLSAVARSGLFSDIIGQPSVVVQTGFGSAYGSGYGSFGPEGSVPPTLSKGFGNDYAVTYGA